MAPVLLGDSVFSYGAQRRVTAVFLAYLIAVTLLLPVMLWCAFAAGVKLLHDRGWSGWVLLIFWIPYLLMGIGGALQPLPGARVPTDPIAQQNLAFGLLLSLTGLIIFGGLAIWMLVVMGFLRGEQGPNRYGSDPRARSAEPAGAAA